MKKVIEMSKNDDHTIGNLLDYEYFSRHYKLIAIDLSKQIELENPELKQQINFIGRLEEAKITIFFIIEKIRRTNFWIFTKFCKHYIKWKDKRLQTFWMILAMKNLNFLHKKWCVIDNQIAKGKYYQNNSIKFETESIKSSLCDYYDEFILVTGDITVTANNNTNVAFKNLAPFSTCKKWCCVMLMMMCLLMN